MLHHLIREREGDDNDEGLTDSMYGSKHKKCMHERRSPREPPKGVDNGCRTEVYAVLVSHQALSLNLRFRLVLVHTLTLNELRTPGQ
jgi:hypothetical protein